MRKILCFLSVVVLLAGCNKENVDELQKEIDRQYESLLEAVNNRLLVTGYAEMGDTYIITMSDNSQRSINNCRVTLAGGVMTFTFADGRTVRINAAVPEVTITEPAGGFVVDKMKWLLIQPQATAASDVSYKWSLSGKEIAGEKDLRWVFTKAGAYTLELKATNGMGESVRTVTVTVNDRTCVNGVTRVFEYLPAPGQFINVLPEATAGDTPETMRQKAEAVLTAGSLISLGGFGGYVVFGFDHTVVNRSGNDFTVLGNAISGFGEPGVIMVSYDANGNGLPDDEWFEIAGSEYHKPTTIRNYEITYYKPATEPDISDEPTTSALASAFFVEPTNTVAATTEQCLEEHLRVLNEPTNPVAVTTRSLSFIQIPRITEPTNPVAATTRSASEYIRWTDNQGQSGYLAKNSSHTQPYYPLWIGESYTLKGTLMVANIIDPSGAGSDWVNPPYDSGYADNFPNTDARAQIDMDWAVDGNGNPVRLTGIDFVKVYTANRATAGWLGEVSTEVAGITDLNF